MMAHNQGFSFSCLKEPDSQSFLWKTTLGNPIEDLKIEGHSFFNSVVEIISLGGIFKVIMADTSVKGYCQSIRKDFWNTPFGFLSLIVGVENFGCFKDSIKHGLFLTELFS